MCESIETSVKLFYKGSPLPLPQWFHHGRDCDLTTKSVMQNFLNYIRLQGEQTFNILEELKELKFKKKRTLLSNVIRYLLLLRYNYLQTYRLLMKDLPFPSLPLLKKPTEGQLDAVKCPKSLKSQGVICEDIVLFEMKTMSLGLLAFMIIELKENVH